MFDNTKYKTKVTCANSHVISNVNLLLASINGILYDFIGALFVKIRLRLRVFCICDLCYNSGMGIFEWRSPVCMILMSGSMYLNSIPIKK